MSLFKKIFGGTGASEEEKQLPWINLSRLDELDAIEEKSNEKLQVIFKHSTRCGISRMVIKRFVEQYDLSEDEVDLYYLDLLNFRDVSNEVGYKFQVLHQSPQILIIKNGETIHHESHHSIDANVIPTLL